MSTNLSNPKHGEIWLVNFDPSVGAEIHKVRPAVVVSADYIGKLPLKLVAPITDWKSHYLRYIWLVQILPDSTNGLTKTSAIDTFQMRSVSLHRFVSYIGLISPSTMEEINLAIANVIEYP